MVNDLNNQQDATTFPFINLFKSAQHVSGDKFAHPQEHLLTVYTDFGKMHRLCCQPVPRWHRSSAEAVHCTKSWLYSQKLLLRMGEFVARNMLGWIKNINKRKNCSILLVIYAHRCTKMIHGHTNINTEGNVSFFTGLQSVFTFLYQRYN